MREDYYKKCKICDKEFTQAVDFNRHIKSHSMKVSDYILKHELDGINPTCKCGCGEPTNFDAVSGELERGFYRNFVNGHNQRMVIPKEKVLPEMKRNYEPYECKVCGTMLRSPRAYKSHVQKEHGIDMKDYVIKYLWNGVEPKCECGCDKTTNFEFAEDLRHNNYYHKLVSGHHWNLQEFRDKVPQTMEKIKKTNLEKYGVDNVFKSDLIKNKAKKTKLEKYGDENFTNIDKQVQTKKDLYSIKTLDEKILEQTMKKNSRIKAKLEKSKTKELSKMNKIYEQPIRENVDVKSMVDNNPHVCKLCGDNNTVHGMRTHLSHKHDGYNVEKYVSEFGEFRQDYLNKQIMQNNSGIICEICKEKQVSERGLSYHVQIAHGIDKVSYIKKYIFNNEIQLCACGCGKEVNIIPHGFDDNKNRTYRRQYAKGCNNPIRKSIIVSDETRAKMRESAFKRMVGGTNKVDTIGERTFKDFLTNLGINFVQQHSTDFGNVDFYLPDHDLLIEIDGEYYHPTIKERLNIKQLSGAISDYGKFGKVDYRILDTDVKYLESLNDLDLYNRTVQMDIPYDQVIVDKNYFKDVLTRKGAEYLQSHTYLLFKFVRRYFKEFPYPTSNQKLEDIMDTIFHYDTSTIYNDENKSFSNSCHHIGNSYLKSLFKSYYHTRFKQGKSPVENFYDDVTLKTILRFRCGLNDSNEVYDFSAKEIIKGLSAIRSTVSFFKPLLASTIYKKFLDCKSSPLVLDPCCGFGGRLLGFKSTYPNGIYVGCEPNLDTYNELMELSKDMEDVYIYNCRFEDFDDLYDNSYDLVFTSIPYYDLEIYSNHQEYDNIEHWEQTFIKSLMKFNNLCLNVPKNLEYMFKDYSYDIYFINQSQAKQFDKRIGSKSELLLKFK